MRRRGGSGRWREVVAIVAAWTLTSCEAERAREAPSGAIARGRPDAQGICTEHGVPFELCTRCNPALAQVFRAKGDWCEEHEFPESFCPICHPDAVAPDVSSPAPTPGESVRDGGGAADRVPPAVGAIEGRVVRLKSPSIEDDAGIATVAAVRAERAPSIACSARLVFDADQVADVRALVPGIVRTIDVSLGQKVERGDRIVVLESAQVGQMQGALLAARERVRAARANVTRKRTLRDEQIASARSVEVAEQELAAAEAASAAAASSVRVAGASGGRPSGRYTIEAPIAGQIVRRPAVLGALADADTPIATIADVSTMWALCDVPEGASHDVSLGQRLVLEGARGDHGLITWISPEVDARTRAVTVRAEIPNDDRRLRANQFLSARVETGPPERAVVVPARAIQRVEGHLVVFVRASKGTYLPRVVEVFGDGERVAVVGRLKEGEEVVTEGAVWLRTEALPGSVGAGCCEVGPVEGGE